MERALEFAAQVDGDFENQCRAVLSSEAFQKGGLVMINSDDAEKVFSLPVDHVGHFYGEWFGIWFYASPFIPSGTLSAMRSGCLFDLDPSGPE